MAATPITFIVTTSTQRQSKNEQEIQSARARAHAARISHHRRHQSTDKSHESHSRDVGSGLSTSSLAIANNRVQSKQHLSESSLFPHTGFGSFRTELCSTFPEVDSPHLRPILDYWCYSANPTNDLFTELFNITNPYPYFLPLMSNPVFYHAGFSVLWSILKRELDPTAPPSATGLMHRGHAMTQVREHLGREQWSVGTTSAIVFLAILEFATGNRDATHHHLQGLKNMLDRRGGIDSLQPDEKNFVMHFESSFVLLFGTSPFTRRVRKRSKGIPRSWNLDMIPSGFAVLVRERRISTDMVEVLTRAAEVIKDLNHPARHNMRQERRKETRRYNDCLEACPVLLEPDSEDNILDKMVCFSLILYSSLEHRARVPSGWWRASKTHLSSRLVKFRPSTRAEMDCVAWIYILVIDSCRIYSDPWNMSRDGLVLLAKFHKIFPEFGIGQWVALEPILRGFFWTKGLSSLWSVSWDALILVSPSTDDHQSSDSNDRGPS